jgi:hypothetical protein
MTTGRMVQIAVALGGVIVGAVCAVGGQALTLRSAHARPAAVAMSGQVAVTPEGKLFHDPSCPLVHGPVRLMDSAEAVRLGYSPCTRCLTRAFGQDQ